MTETSKRSAALFEELVEALVDEGMQTGEFDIDSMRFAQMERLGHGLGKELSRRVQADLARRQGQRMPDAFPCPRCGRDCPTETRPKPLTTLDGDVHIPAGTAGAGGESRCFCKSCRKAFFPSA